METSILIAKLIGVTYLFAGLGFLLNADYYLKSIKELLKSAAFMMFGGMMATLMGVLMITYHNVWSGPWWVVLITLIGWIALVKGFVFMAFPKSLSALLPMYKKEYIPFWAILMLAVGAIYSYYGFFA